MQNHKLDFRTFIEDTSSGAFTTDKVDSSSYDGRLHPQVTLDFPTVTKSGQVLRVKVKGANYCIQIEGGTTVLIPRKKYHIKYNRLPRAKTVTHSGDRVTAVFYKYKDRNKENHDLKSFHLDQVR
jgi:hypothetical protein